MERARARPRRIPAFGHWNMNSRGDVDGDGNGNGDGVWPAAINQCFELKTAIAHKPLDMVRRDGNGVAMGKQHSVWQSRVADSGAHVARKPFSFTVVKAVDVDLYEVPPDMLGRQATEKGGTWLRRLLMGCFGLNCIA